MKTIFGLFAILWMFNSQHSHAEEIFVGASFNGVDTPFSLDTSEDGANIQIGVRGKPEKSLKAIGSPSLYIFLSVNDGNDTNFIAAGLSWHVDLAKKLYLRPGVGFALQGRTAQRFRASDGRRIDLGSPILFEPELVLGYKFTDKIAGELTWQHISHATLFSGQNPGVDLIGARVAFKF